MKRVMVTYKVKSDRIEENKQFIEKVFTELNKNQPESLRYASFLKEDGISFVHLASIETEDGSNPLSNSEAFKAFSSNIKDRCVELPKAIELFKVGSYNLF